MPRVKTTLPEVPSRVKGQKSLDLPFIHRLFPQWLQPNWQRAEFWRALVRSLPVASDCRDALIGYTQALEWKIEPKDSSMRNELRSEVEYYTELFTKGGRDIPGWDFSSLLEMGGTEILDTPFGFGAETIREGDKPGGRVVEIIPIDSATLFPTLDDKWPIAQRLMESPVDLVVFPKHAINRMYMNPRPEIRYEGWGMPPPERIFLAIEMVRRGDEYYSKLLVDTPEAGLLDLGDMSKSDAEEWIQACQDLMTGIDPFKVPVLYQHTVQAKWIPFGKPPTDLMFDKTYLQYVTLICAAYGLSPGDIGFASKGGGGGETLAGSIRDERKTRKQGLARLKLKWQNFFNRILPDTLKFTWVDLDDEVSIALARSRLANATAMGQYIEAGMFTEKEARLQTIADGLWSTSVPEDIPVDEFLNNPEKQEMPERPGMLGAPVKPSFGGHGEVLPRSLSKYLHLDDVQIRKAARSVIPVVVNEANSVFRDLNVDEFDSWIRWHDNVLWSEFHEDIPELTLSTIFDSGRTLDKLIQSEQWLSLNTRDVTDCINDKVSFFSEIRQNVLLEKSRLDYEEGRSKTYLKQVDEDKEAEKQFKSNFRSDLREYWKSVPEKLSKAILAGVRNSLIRMGKVQILDTGENIDDNIYIVPSVRNELIKLERMMNDELDEILINTITKILGEE